MLSRQVLPCMVISLFKKPERHWRFPYHKITASSCMLYLKGKGYNPCNWKVKTFNHARYGYSHFLYNDPCSAFCNTQNNCLQWKISAQGSLQYRFLKCWMDETYCIVQYRSQAAPRMQHNPLRQSFFSWANSRKDIW